MLDEIKETLRTIRLTDMSRLHIVDQLRWAVGEIDRIQSQLDPIETPTEAALHYQLQLADASKERLIASFTKVLIEYVADLKDVAMQRDMAEAAFDDAHDEVGRIEAKNKQLRYALNQMVLRYSQTIGVEDWLDDALKED